MISYIVTSTKYIDMILNSIILRKMIADCYDITYIYTIRVILSTYTHRFIED